MPAYNLVQSGGRSAPFTADFTDTAILEPAAEAAEAVALEAVSNTPHWEYSATAEDNGTVGDLDAQPGVVFKGPVTTAQRVSIRDMTIGNGTIAPAAGDKYAIGVYKNSELQVTLDNESVADEFVFDELDTETIVAECDAIIDAVAPDDVIRVAVISVGEGAADIEVVGTAGMVSIG